MVLDETHLSNRMGFSPGKIKAHREKEKRNLELIREKVEKCRKLVFLMGQGRGLNTGPGLSSIIRTEGIPVFSNSRRAARVMRHLVWYQQYLDAITRKSP